MTRHISALFEDREAAAEAVQRLKGAGFLDREMTVVAKADRDTEDALAKASHATALTSESGRGGFWAGSALGAAVAGSVGLLSVALIPAIPLLLVGGAAVGGAAGLTMSSLGVGEHQAKEAALALREGGVLVVVHQETDERAEEARDVLSESHPRGPVAIL